MALRTVNFNKSEKGWAAIFRWNYCPVRWDVTASGKS